VRKGLLQCMRSFPALPHGTARRGTLFASGKESVFNGLRVHNLAKGSGLLGLWQLAWGLRPTSKVDGK
jgi:hypothetical protein